MKRYFTILLSVCMMLTAFSMPASAEEYIFDGEKGGTFAEPTSDNTIYVATRDDTNIDRIAVSRRSLSSASGTTSFMGFPSV